MSNRYFNVKISERDEVFKKKGGPVSVRFQMLVRNERICNEKDTPLGAFSSKR